MARHHSDETVLTRYAGFGVATCTNIPLRNSAIGAELDSFWSYATN